MSDSKPIVYAYLDLAERLSGSGAPQSVPMSNGMDWYLDGAYWNLIGDAVEWRDRSIDWGVVFVRGARALEVAEREVRDMMREFVHEPDVIGNVVRRDDLIDCMAHAQGGWRSVTVRANDCPRLARAVDIRDRLREAFKRKDAEKRDMRERVGLPSPSVHWIIPGTTGPACWTANGLVASMPYHLNNQPAFVTCQSCTRVIADHARKVTVPITPITVKTDVNDAIEVMKRAKPAPETQPVFLATLRPSDSRDDSARPWAVSGRGGWQWYLTDAQADELKSTGKTEDVDRDGKTIAFVAQDWKPKFHADIDASSMEEIRKDVDVTAQEVKPMPSIQTFTVNLDTSEAVAKLHDVQALAAQVGREVAEALKKEAKPMPDKPAPKPDPHDKCRVSLRDGVLVDDYGRTFHGVMSLDGGDRLNCAAILWESVRLVIKLSDVPPDSVARPAHAPFPIVLKSDRELCQSEAARIAADFRAHGQSVIILPPHLQRAELPEEEMVRADIDRRANLAAARRTGWHCGLAVGAIAALALSVGALLAVARFKPEWLARLAHRQHASAENGTLQTPWSPAALDARDEHAQESEDADRDAREREAK